RAFALSKLGGQRGVWLALALSREARLEHVELGFLALFPKLPPQPLHYPIQEGKRPMILECLFRCAIILRLDPVTGFSFIQLHWDGRHSPTAFARAVFVPFIGEEPLQGCQQKGAKPAFRQRRAGLRIALVPRRHHDRPVRRHERSAAPQRFGRGRRRRPGFVRSCHKRYYASRLAHIHQHLPHRPATELLERLRQLAERIDLVNERTEASGGEQREHLLPGLAAFGIAVSTHRHATEPKPAEKEQGRVKIRDWPRQSSHQAYLAMVAEGFNDFRQKRAADIVDRQVHPARRYRYFKGLTPERVL